VLTQSAPDLFGDVPTGVVPGEEQDLPAKAFEPLGAPPKELGRYIAHGPAIHESQLRIADLWQIAFGATEAYRAEDPTGSVAVSRLSVGGAEFWVDGESPEHGNKRETVLLGDE
jgi:hypothetical protein